MGGMEQERHHIVLYEGAYIPCRCGAFMCPPQGGFVPNYKLEVGNWGAGSFREGFSERVGFGKRGVVLAGYSSLITLTATLSLAFVMHRQTPMWGSLILSS